MTTPLTTSPMREQFETAVYLRIYTNSIRFPAYARALVTNMTKAEVCARSENGEYIEPTLNPAWWAWQEAHENCAKLADKCAWADVAQVIRGLK